MSTHRHYGRCLLSSFAGFCFAMLVVCAYKTWQYASAQHWAALDYDWLALDWWSRSWELNEALAGAGMTLILALIGEHFAANQTAILRLIRWANRLASRAWVLILLAFLAFGLPRTAASLSQPDAPEDAPNVLYVMVDTWRADHVGWLGYPRNVTPGLDQLVQSGVIYENTVSSSGWTKPSVATQLTGLIPSKHAAVSQPIPGIAVHGTKLPLDRLTWIEVLRAEGWDTAMWSNNPNILPTHGFDQGAGYFFDYVKHPDRVGSSEGAAGFDPGRAEYMLPDVRQWIDQSWDRSRPFAAYVHLMDPHYPYVAPAPFQGTFDQTGSDFQLDGEVCGDYIKGKADVADVTPLMLERINAIYDEEILYVDHYLTPFLRDMMAEFPNTVVVLVSDHGEEFLEHGQFGHGHSLYDELVKVPLVIWAPGLEAKRVPWQVRLLDVFPTLVELVGAQIMLADDHIQGKSLVDMQPAHRLAPMESGGDERPPWHWRALSDGTWKMHERLEVNPDDHESWLEGIPVLDQVREEKGMPYFQIYHLPDDPGEQNDLVKTEIKRARSMKKLMVDRLWHWPADLVLKFGSSSDLGADLDHLIRMGYADPPKVEAEPPTDREKSE
jgi:arylsulfatase A-like enzyme